MDQTSTLPEPLRLSYTGDGTEIVRILIRNGLLTILTLGIFRFWAKTRMRRYIWGSFQIDDDAVEYTGTGKELFVGFLMVLPVGLICWAAYSTIGRMLDPFSWVIWAYQGVGVFFILLLSAVASYFTHRYRMSRTSWRGIRGGFDGKFKEYFLLALKYTLLTFMTLGLKYPDGVIARQNYLFSRSSFGTLPMTCRATVGAARRPWLALNVLGLALLIPLILEGGFSVNFQIESWGVFIYFYLFIMTPVAISIILIYVTYRIRMLRQRLNGLSIEGMSIRSDISLRPIGGQMVAALLVWLLSILFYPFVVTGVLTMAGDVGQGAGLLPFLLLVVPLVTATGLVGWYVLWLNPFYRALVQTTRLTGSFDPAGLGQNAIPVPTRGEGLYEFVG